MVGKKLDQKEFTEAFQKLFEPDARFVFFGAGEIGMRAVLRMDYLGLKHKILCFSDNDDKKAGGGYRGYSHCFEA